MPAPGEPVTHVTPGDLYTARGKPCVLQAPYGGSQRVRTLTDAPLVTHPQALPARRRAAMRIASFARIICGDAHSNAQRALFAPARPLATFSFQAFCSTNPTRSACANP